MNGVRLTLRVLSALLAAALLALGVVVTVEIVLAALGQPAWVLPYADVATTLRERTWDSVLARAVAAALCLLGLLLLLQNVVLAVTRGTAYSVSTPVAQISVGLGPVQIGLSRIIVLVAATVVAGALGLWLQRTVLGRAIRAVAQDHRAATLMGVNTDRIYMLSFGIGAGLAGLAGCLLVPLYTMSPQIGTNFILPAFAVVVLGGLGSVAGAYIGGFIVGMTEALAGYYLDPALKHAVLFAVFIAVLVVRPSGLFGQVGAEEVGLREQA